MRGLNHSRAGIIAPILLALCTVLVAVACGERHHAHGTMSGSSEETDLGKRLTFLVGDIKFDAKGEPQRALPGEGPLSWEPYNSRVPALNVLDPKPLWISVRLPLFSYYNPVIFIPGGSYLQDFQAYSAGKLIYDSARPCVLELRAPSMESHLVPVPAAARGQTVYLKFQARQRGPFGLVDSIYLSSERNIISRIVREQTDRLVLGFIFIFSGLLTFFIFLRLWLRSGRKNYSILAFFIMSASVGLFVIFSSDIATLFFAGPRFADYVNLLSLTVFPIGLFLFVDQTISPGFGKIIRRSWQIHLILAVMAGIALLRGVSIPPLFIILIRFSVFFVGLVASLAEIIRAILKGRRGARITSIGLLIFGFYAVCDLLMKLKILQYRVLHFHWGYLFMMLLLGWLLYRKSEENREKLKIYSEELEEKSAILQELNRTLEEKVQERTEELQEKNAELRDINRILADRNRIIENEILMAKKIQRQLIPARAPRSNIAALYRPMDQVGGDFYDFIDLGEEGRMGLFISDVSGHGIPAALITAMVKTTILQAGRKREDPADLLSFLNELLFGKTGDNFITAFYGILDLDENELVWSSAGHNPPFIISQGNITTLTGSRSLPIATMSNRMLEEAGKSYKNNSTILSRGSKLLMFTDGLTEAVRLDDPGPDFESAGLMKTLGEESHLPPGDFVDRLLRSLVAFRGSESFEDDVCMVCVDINSSPQS